MVYVCDSLCVNPYDHDEHVDCCHGTALWRYCKGQAKASEQVQSRNDPWFLEPHWCSKRIQRVKVHLDCLPRRKYSSGKTGRPLDIVWPQSPTLRYAQWHQEWTIVDERRIQNFNRLNCK